jgi:hypothetical protein
MNGLHVRTQIILLQAKKLQKVQKLVPEKWFRRAKFVDPNSGLMYDEKDGSICKFATIFCYLQADIDISTWWKQARKGIPTNISGYTTRKVWP